MRGLWWLLVLGLLVTGGAAAYMISLVIEARERPSLGDGHDPRTYGFPLEPLLVPEASLVGSGLAKDGLEILDPVLRYSAEKATSYRGRDKYVVSEDLVVGVVVNGRPAAYPIQILSWHEALNDTLGGVPIVVSYSPLAGGVAVFDRRVGGETLEFGISGLLLESHHLLYDRRPDPTLESLWSPLLGRAVAGPAAARGDSLRPIDGQLLRWKAWVTRHPSTEVLARDDSRIMAYRRSPYVSYFGNDELRFPVSQLPPDRSIRPYKTRILALRTDGGWSLYSLPELLERAGARGVWETSQDGVPLRFTTFEGDPPTAWVERTDPGPAPEVRGAFWFAWYALRPGDTFR